VPGTSRANVDRYLSGKVDKPPVDFYVEAARLLEVPLLWLLGVTDAATTEELTGEERARQESMRSYWLGFHEAISRGFQDYEDLSATAREAVQAAWAAYDHRLSFSDNPPQHNFAGVEEIGQALQAPLRALSIDPADLTLWQLDRYVVGICQALSFLNLKYGEDVQAAITGKVET
jgi:transcriptional regulator with XRE-family HTH domain